jgi:hypothetical protein
MKADQILGTGDRTNPHWSLDHLSSLQISSPLYRKALGDIPGMQAQFFNNSISSLHNAEEDKVIIMSPSSFPRQ